MIPSPTDRAVACRAARAYRANTMDRALIDWYRRFPEGWWGYHWSMPQPMSAVEIIGSGSLDARLMATLWALMARRRGVMLASEAPQAGKTTTLSALVDFLPDHTVGVFLRGWAQDSGWTDEIGPDRGFLLVNEMSDHLPIYVWGPNARAAMRLAGDGYGFGGTMHADSLEEALECLRGELGATDPDLAGLTVYLQYSAYRTPSGMYRRVEEAWHLRTDATGALVPVRLAAIEGGRSPKLTGAQRLPVPPTLASDGGRRGRTLIHDADAYSVLAASLGLVAADLEAELAERAAFLIALADRGICAPPDVAAAVAGYPNLPAPASEGASA
jgi:hypothetical protein